MPPQQSQPSYTYVVHAQGSSSLAADFDDPHERALEVSISWQHDVLFHSECDARRDFHLGAVPRRPRRWPLRSEPVTHFTLPPELLGKTTVQLIGNTAHGPSVLVSELPNGCLFTYDAATVDYAALVASCRKRGWCDARGETVYWPLTGNPLRITLGDFHIACGEASKARPMPRSLFSSLDSESLVYFGLSFASAGAMLASAAFFTPALNLTAGEGIERDDLITMLQYLDAAAEREQLRQEHTGESDQATTSGESAERAHHTEGATGDANSTATNKRYAVKGPIDNPDPHLARQRALEEAVNFGMLGLLNAATSDPNAPSAPWGRATSLGLDPASALGNMWGDAIGNSFGAGLGMTGTGSGGGDRGEAIGVGGVGTLGRGMGPDGEYGFGSHHGRLPGTHATRGVRMRTPGVDVSGRLPPQIIQRIVRQNHGRFRLCYERGLGANPSLSGRVNVRFVIGRNGAVSNVSNAGSSLPNGEVVNCVVRAFYGLSFPQPEGGLVTVSYPIAFSPE